MALSNGRFRLSFLVAGFWLCVLGMAQTTPEMPKFSATRVPQVGEPVPGRVRASKVQCMVNSAQFYPCYSLSANGVGYIVAYRGTDSNSGVVADVRTIDSKFKTPEGLRVGEVIAIRSRDDLILAPYFATYANRGTEWVPVIGFLENLSTVEPDGEDKIVPLNSIEFNGSEIRVRISGFVQRKGVDPESGSKD